MGTRATINIFKRMFGIKKANAFCAILFCLFTLNLSAQTAFTSGDKVDVYYGGTGTEDTIADDNDSPARTYNYFKILNTKFKPNNV